MSTGKERYSASEIAPIVEPIARRHNVISVYMSGSGTIRNFGPDSDYDFILETTDDFSFSDYCGFADELSEALGGLVDIVDHSCLRDDGFSRRVGREAVHVWGRSRSGSLGKID